MTGATFPPLSDGQMKRLRALRSKKGREAAGALLVETIRAVETALDAADVRPGLLGLTDDAGDRATALAERWTAAGGEVRSLTAAQADELTDAVTAQGVVASVEVPERRWPTVRSALSEPRRSVVLALDGVADPGNLGTLIRTADWFGVSAVLVGAGTTDWTAPKVVRAAMGSLWHRPPVRVDLPAALAQLRDDGFTVRGATLDADSRPDTSLGRPDRICLVLGSEAHGLSPEVDRALNERVHIAGRIGAGAESLNVALAGAILLAGLR